MDVYLKHPDISVARRAKTSATKIAGHPAELFQIDFDSGAKRIARLDAPCGRTSDRQPRMPIHSAPSVCAGGQAGQEDGHQRVGVGADPVGVVRISAGEQADFGGVDIGQ